jgi:hypothetical protein
MARLLLILLQLFMLWMLVDAVRRRADYYWFLVILLPFGEWIYFFSVKIKDPEFDKLRAFFNPPRKKETLEALRCRVAESPSALNRLRLAQALHDNGEFEPACEHFAQVRRQMPDDREALYGWARCRAELGDVPGAIVALEELIEREPAYADYEPWAHLATQLRRAGQLELALNELGRLWKMAPRLNHALLYAHFLAEAGQVERARALLAEALQSFRTSPRFAQQRQWQWASPARELLRSLKGRSDTTSRASARGA